MKLLGETRSLCPTCFKEIKAKIVEKNGKTVMLKTCKNHGTFESLHVWDDPVMYTSMVNIFKNIRVSAEEKGFELTSRCNMKCPFCFVNADENGGKKKIELSKEEILKNIENLRDHTVVFSGGEPTVRDDLFDFIKEVKKRGLRAGILTNGLKLNKDYVKKLKELKLDKIQLQLDALDDDCYQILRGQKCLNKKLDAISNLKDSGIYLNLFVMLAKGVNDIHIKDIIKFAINNSETVNGVIFSSLCYEGRHNSNLKKMSNSDIMKNIEEQVGITRQDFLECTKFDIVFSQTIGKKIRAKSISPCDVICYLYVDGGKAIPVNKLLDLSFFIKQLENHSDTNKFLFSIINPFNIKKFLKRREALPLLLKLFFSTLRQLVAGKMNTNYIMGILVTNFHDRYNVDLNLLDNCTIHAFDGKSFVPFCKKNILWNKDIMMPLKS